MKAKELVLRFTLLRCLYLGGICLRQRAAASEGMMISRSRLACSLWGVRK